MEKVVIKKSEIIPLLMQIGVYSQETGALIGGLLSEKLTLGTKRLLQRIQKALQLEYEQFEKERNEVFNLEKEGKTKEEVQKELLDLLNEDVTLEIERLDIKKIEEIETNANYEFSLLEKIAK